MRRVEKGTEPDTVRDTRLSATTNLSTGPTARSAFDQVDKELVRERLAGEQGQLCVFCMRPIRRATKIAHRRPIAVAPELALTWTNLFAACSGGELGAHRTCDTAQGDTDLVVDPTSQSSMASIRYEARPPRSGLFITSTDPAVRAEVDEREGPGGSTRPGVLALNTGDLPELRQKAWEAFRDQQRRAHPGAYGKPAMRAFYEKWVARERPRLPAMVGVIEAKLHERG